jgi:hypothetical protein
VIVDPASTCPRTRAVRERRRGGPWRPKVWKACRLCGAPRARKSAASRRLAVAASLYLSSEGLSPMSATTKRGCIFCDEPTKLTKEHLWSKWIRQLVRHDASKHEQTNQVFNISAVDRTAKTIAGDVRNRGIKAVCGKCNSGWMSSIEERAKPALRPLTKGAPAFLNRDSQSDVATWIAMKTMVAEYFDPTKIAIPLSERQFLRDNRRAPDANWRIWIGNYERTKWGAQLVHGSHGIAPSISVAGRDPKVFEYTNHDIRGWKALRAHIQQRDR